MALTFSDALVDTLWGSKKFKIYEITHDEATTDITAASLGFHYVDYSLLDNVGALSSDAARFNYMATPTGTTIAMTTALSTNAVTALRIWGY